MKPTSGPTAPDISYTDNWLRVYEFRFYDTDEPGRKLQNNHSTKWTI